jgi:hypothetical protein
MVYPAMRLTAKFGIGRNCTRCQERAAKGGAPYNVRKETRSC